MGSRTRLPGARAPPIAGGGAKRQPAGASPPSPQQLHTGINPSVISNHLHTCGDKFSLNEAAARSIRNKTAGEDEDCGRAQPHRGPRADCGGSYGPPPWRPAGASSPSPKLPNRVPTGVLDAERGSTFNPGRGPAPGEPNQAADPHPRKSGTDTCAAGSGTAPCSATGSGTAPSEPNHGSRSSPAKIGGIGNNNTETGCKLDVSGMHSIPFRNGTSMGENVVTWDINVLLRLKLPPDLQM